MAGLPRNIIKKYGVSKKAWAVYRGARGNSKKSGGIMAKKKSYSRGGGFGMGGVKSMATKAAVGLGAVAILGLVAPQFKGNKIIQAAAGYALGGPIGAGAAYLLGGNGNGANGSSMYL